MLANSSSRRTDESLEDSGGLYVFPPSWQGLKQQVIYLAQFGGGIQVVEGVAGAGKSTFSLWLSDDQDSLPMSMMCLHPASEVNSLFFELLQQLGLRPPSTASAGKLLVMLRSYVQSLLREGARAVMLIDDAQWIDDSELAALISVMQDSTESGQGLHLILMSEPGLAARIDDLQLLDVSVHDAAIPALSAAEVATLMIKRLSSGGHTNLGPENAQKIWSQSRGIPGRVVEILSSKPVAKQPQMREPQHRPAERAVESRGLRGWPIMHFVALAVLVSILAWAYLAQNEESAPSVRSIEVPLPPATIAVSNEEPVFATREEGNLHLDENGDETSLVERADLELVASSEIEGLEDGEEFVAVDAKSAVVDSATDSDGSFGGARGVVVGERGAREDSLSSDSGPSSVGLEVVPADEPKLDTPAASEEPKVQVAARPTQSTDVVADSEAKLLRLASSGYVLQLMASSVPNKLFDFLNNQPNRSNLMIYRANRNGQVLHILVEGFYADKGAAGAGIANLPAAQKKGGPWPKRIDLIQQEINAYRGR